jgi:hypothetical protein
LFSERTQASTRAQMADTGSDVIDVAAVFGVGIDK